jgi:hypothetical protein
MAKKEKVSRRNFVKHASVGAVGAAVAQVRPVAAQRASQLPASYDRVRVMAALGDTLIPSGPEDPGYATLEPYNITAEVMKGLDSIPDENLALFNSESSRIHGDKTFVELSEAQRADYLNMIVDGVNFSDTGVLEKLRSVYRLVRVRVFVVFYQNYPQHIFPRDDNGVPIITEDNEHQITNPNSPGIVTGWDIAGWKGPMTWEEEEERRAHFKKIDWKDW